ncbi:phage-associated protein, BcepMu gp16 family [Pseudomonas aeruginosa]|nr:phage-associated protein, BcepMu gp16 family [Pseudomonas aeruginosa]
MTPNQIRARLVEKGSSYRKFALARGYEPRNVTQVVARWAGAERLPNGRLAYAILKDLSEVDYPRSGRHFQPHNEALSKASGLTPPR